MHRTWLNVGYKWSTIEVEIKRRKGAVSIHNHSILSITLFMSSKNLSMLIIKALQGVIQSLKQTQFQQANILIYLKSFLMNNIYASDNDFIFIKRSALK